MVGSTHPVLDHGFVELISALGTDSTVADAARASSGGSGGVTPAARTTRDTGLINRLMADGHTSPFEHIVMSFRVRAPLVVSTQWARHRFSSFNQESGRYSELKDEFYCPGQYLINAQPVKPMGYEVGRLDSEDDRLMAAAIFAEHASKCRETYEALLALGVAREQARLVLPVSQYTTFVWTVNGLGLMNWLRLRDHGHAQYEIRQYASIIRAMFAEQYPVVERAFSEHWVQDATPGWPGVV